MALPIFYPTMRRLLCILLLFAPVTLVARDTTSLRQTEKIARACRAINNLYVDSVVLSPQGVERMEELLVGLDPYTTYLSAEQVLQMREHLTKGAFVGVGVEVASLRDTLVVLKTLPESPAEWAGVLPNDRILRIDTTSVLGLNPQEALPYLRGRKGTRVQMEVVRCGVREPLRFTLRRQRIPLTTIEAAHKDSLGVGYIKVSHFAKGTMWEFEQAYRKLGSPQSLILDLRGNRGGLLGEAVRMALFFLPKGALILSVEGRKIPLQRFLAERDGENLRGKVVVLIDEHTASASEIVAGALQDWDRAIIVGCTSVGKGLVQRHVALGDGSALAISIARYRTPSGRVIQRPYNPKSEAVAATSHKTLRAGREVCGGAGIRPDVIVACDTLNLPLNDTSNSEWQQAHTLLLRWEELGAPLLQNHTKQ